MVLTGNKYLGPDIWPEIPDQGEGTKDMMRTI